MVSSIVDNEPTDWDYGCVDKIYTKINSNSYFLFTTSAYTNYIDNLLLNGKVSSFFFIFGC